jgi:DnaJ-class molecular chaperone
MPPGSLGKCPTCGETEFYKRVQSSDNCRRCDGSGQESRPHYRQPGQTYLVDCSNCGGTGKQVEYVDMRISD